METRFLNARTLQNHNEQKAGHFELQSHLHSGAEQRKETAREGLHGERFYHMLSKGQRGALTPASLGQQWDYL